MAVLFAALTACQQDPATDEDCAATQATLNALCTRQIHYATLRDQANAAGNPSLAQRHQDSSIAVYLRGRDLAQNSLCQSLITCD